MIEIENPGSNTRRAVSGELLQLLQQPVDILGLSVGSYNSMLKRNIRTVAELATKSETEVLRIALFGQKTLNDVKEALAPHGLSLGSKFYDGSSGQGLDVREVLSADAGRQIEQERSSLAAAMVPQMNPELRAEIAYVFKQVAAEMAWPMPLKVQEDLTRRLRLARALDEYTKR